MNTQTQTLQSAPAPQRPWRRKSKNDVLIVVVASIAPGLIAFTANALDILSGFLAGVLFIILQISAGAAAGVIHRGRRGLSDGVLISAIGFAISFVAIMMSSVIWSVATKGFEALKFQFLIQNNEFITPTSPLGYGGIGHAILGTLIIVGIATLISVPIGIATAVYITEVRGRSRVLVQGLVQAMSGVPSVVAGLFIFATLIFTNISEYNGAMGALAYTILMLPTVARTAEEVLRLVPEDLRAAALALGASRARVVSMVVIPTAKAGLITAMLLGIARVVGETAPLVFTIFGSAKTNINPVDGPMAALPLYIFNGVRQPFAPEQARAYSAALVLLVLVIIFFTLARVLSSGLRKGK
jgi:phosphate transport system permease protein